MLKGKKLGLVGFGLIGQRVAELASVFGMEVSYWSRQKRDGRQVKDVKFKPLEQLFSESDIVSVHLSPYATPRIISRDLLALLKDKAIFINTSAGRLVDQGALWTELESKRISAYIDVYETLPPRKIIGRLLGKNIFTYRSGWFTQEAVTYKGDSLVEKLRSFLKAEDLMR
jgi:phosphoglycerate dehydrogenase-like enzyme